MKTKTLMSIFIGFMLIGLFKFVRADTTTTRMGMTKPSIGSTGWGSKLNANFDITDSSAAVLSGLNNFTATSTTTWAGGLSTMTTTGQLQLNPNVTQGVILNNNSLQSGSTAYPQYLYVGSTATVTGGFSAGGNAFPTNSGSNNQCLTTNGAGVTSWNSCAGGGASISNQNTLQAGSTAYPQFLYVGSSATFTSTSSSITFQGPAIFNSTVSARGITYPFDTSGRIFQTIIQSVTMSSTTAPTASQQYFLTGSSATVTPRLPDDWLDIHAHGTFFQGTTGDTTYLSIFLNGVNLQPGGSNATGPETLLGGNNATSPYDIYVSTQLSSAATVTANLEMGANGATGGIGGAGPTAVPIWFEIQDRGN